jgi:hypothetical protein
MATSMSIDEIYAGIDRGFEELDNQLEQANGIMRDIITGQRVYWAGNTLVFEGQNRYPVEYPSPSIASIQSLEEFGVPATQEDDDETVAESLSQSTVRYFTPFWVWGEDGEDSDTETVVDDWLDPATSPVSDTFLRVRRDFGSDASTLPPPDNLHGRDFYDDEIIIGDDFPYMHESYLRADEDDLVLL